MHELTAVYALILFVLLTPGLLLRLPEKGPLLNAAIVHAIVFAVLLYAITKLVKYYSEDHHSE
jgi:hypothetical protein